MIDHVLNFIVANKANAPWIVAAALLLAGLNIPISIDIVLVFCAFLSASVIPESTYPLFFSVLFGCYFAGWVAYWSGRLFGRKLLKVPLIAKMLPQEKITKVENYYQKYGVATLVAGRFIPFGVRNAIYISSGMSRMNFFKFALVDFLACSVWATLMFVSFYALGKNFDTLKHHLKLLNIFLFLAFSVTLISIIWYKRRKTSS